MEVSLTGSGRSSAPYYMTRNRGTRVRSTGAAICTAWASCFYDADRPQTLHRRTAMEVIYKHKRAELPEIAPRRRVSGHLRRLLASRGDRYQSEAAARGDLAPKIRRERAKASRIPCCASPHRGLGRGGPKRRRTFC